MMQKRIPRVAKAIYEANRRISPLKLIRNDPTLVEITEPYVQVSGQFSEYRPEDGVLFLWQCIAVHANSVKTINDEIKSGDWVRVMLDEKGTARIIRETRFWDNTQMLINLMKQLGYTLPLIKSSASIVHQIPRSRSP